MMGESPKMLRDSGIGTRSVVRWGQALGIVAGLLGVASDARATRVRGVVTGYQNLVNPVWEEGKDPERHLFSFREPVPTVRAEFRRLFPHIPKELCVAALSAEKQPAQKPILIRVGGGRTTPVTIVVTPGTELQFQNTDPFPHRLFAVGVGEFSASDTVKGGLRSWRIPGPGTFEIRDEAAPSLRMWIVGEPRLAALAFPSMKGEFALTVETPGEYQVQAFFAGKKVGPEVAVKVGTAEIDLGKQPLKVADEPKGEKSN
jgi:plastocyanin